MATIEQRIVALELNVAASMLGDSSPTLRPQVIREEWLELYGRGDSDQDTYPARLREIFIRRGDGSEIRHAEYLRNLE